MKLIMRWNLGVIGLALAIALFLTLAANLGSHNSLLAVGKATSTPTPCFGCFAPPVPRPATMTPLPISRIIDLGPGLPLKDKARIFVRRSSGLYLEFQVPAGWSRSELPLEPGDTIVDEFPPSSLLARTPPRPTARPLRNSSVPMREDEAINFAIQILRDYGLQGSPDSVSASQTNWGRFSPSGNLNESVWFVSLRGTFLQDRSEKLEMYIIFDSITSRILRLGSGTPDALPPGFVVPSPPP